MIVDNIILYKNKRKLIIVFMIVKTRYLLIGIYLTNLGLTRMMKEEFNLPFLVEKTLTLQYGG